MAVRLVFKAIKLAKMYCHTVRISVNVSELGSIYVGGYSFHVFGLFFNVK